MNFTLACQQCGKTYTANKSTGKYCSRRCFHDSRIGAMTGENNPIYVPPIQRTCKTCGASYEVKPSALAPRPGKHQPGVFCSRACADADKRTLTKSKRYNYKGGPYPMACEVCGTIRMVRHSLVRRFRACSRRCALELGRRTWPRTSRLESTMLQAFATAGIAVVPQCPIRCYTVDFAIPSHRLVIECDGIYWHSLPGQVVRDRRKDAYLGKHGWRIIRLTEAEIHESPVACVQRVRDLLPDHLNLPLEL